LRLRRRIFGGARTRILAAFVVLMGFSTAVSVIAIYEVLVVRADDRLDESLQQEVESSAHWRPGPTRRPGSRSTMIWKRSSGSTSSATSPGAARRG
jgi:hypothetical protein